MPVKKVSAEKLEAMEQQRRSSMQTRRASLAEVIPDWPTLQPRKVIKEVCQSQPRRLFHCQFSSFYSSVHPESAMILLIRTVTNKQLIFTS